MHYYFLLQWRMANRQIRDLGTHPVVGWALLGAIFVGLSLYIFTQAPHLAHYIYVGLASFAVLSFKNEEKSNFLQLSFGERPARLIVIYEGLLVSFPFAIFLAAQMLWIYSLICLLLAVGMSAAPIRLASGRSTPTPFYRFPFEFASGFRLSWPAYLISYTIVGIAIWQSHFNMGVLGYAIIHFTAMSFYTQLEADSYIWTFNGKSYNFLLSKTYIALIYSILSCLPMSIALAFAFPESWLWIIVCQALGLPYIVLAVLGKYAMHPFSNHPLQGILMAGCLLFPPFLLVMIPYFFFQAKKKLAHLLP